MFGNYNIFSFFFFFYLLEFYFYWKWELKKIVDVNQWLKTVAYSSQKRCKNCKQNFYRLQETLREKTTTKAIKYQCCLFRRKDLRMFCYYFYFSFADQKKRRKMNNFFFTFVWKTKKKVIFLMLIVIELVYLTEIEINGKICYKYTDVDRHLFTHSPIYTEQQPQP